MQAIPEEESITRHFSFAEVKWTITNITIAVCPLEKTVYSEEFIISSVGVNTIWRLSLSISQEKNTVTVHLKLLGPNRGFYYPGSRKPGLRVNWKCNFVDSVGEQASSSERSFIFKYRDNKAVETFEFTDLLRYLPHFGPDELKLKCHILIDYGRVGTYVTDMNVPNGLLALSNTLAKLPTEPIYPDIQIIIGKTTLSLHKDMFYNVRGMVDLMSKHGYKTINLLNYEGYSLENLFRYAYSGMLSYVISYPRITIAEDIVRMGIPELKGAYPKEIISLKSKLEVNEFVKKWKIENIEQVKETLVGPQFTELGTVWEIRMYPRGKITSNAQEKKYVLLEAVLLWSDKSDIDANIEFCSLDEEGRIIYSQRDYKRMNAEDRLEIPFFLNGGLHMKKCLINENKDLLLQITLRMSTGHVYLRLGQVINPVPFILNNGITLTMFSRKMAKVLQNPEYADIIFACGSYIKLTHKFVLGSRSPFFKARLPTYDGGLLSIPDFHSHFARCFLENLYTGLFSDMELPTICHMCQFGFSFDIRYLIDFCVKEINPQSVLDVLQCADNNNLMHVKSLAYKLLAEIGGGITGHKDWHDFLVKNPNLGLNVLEFLGLKKRNYPEVCT